MAHKEISLRNRLIVCKTDEEYDEFLRLNFEYCDSKLFCNLSNSVKIVKRIPQETNVEYIMKLVPFFVDNAIFDPLNQKVVHKEYFFLKMLRSTGMVPKLEYCIEGKSKVAIIMEKLSNPWFSLHHIMSKSLSNSKIRRIMFNVIFCVIKLNKCNVYHRDIKPLNIMVNCYTLEVKLLDFEHAAYRSSKDSLLSNKMCGTVGFCAPEVIIRRDYNLLDMQTFSIGCLLFYCFEHRVPFQEQNDTINLKHVPTTRMPRNAYEVFQMCTRVDGDRRQNLQSILQLRFFKCSNLMDIITSVSTHIAIMSKRVSENV